MTGLSGEIEEGGKDRVGIGGWVKSTFVDIRDKLGVGVSPIGFIDSMTQRCDEPTCPLSPLFKRFISGLLFRQTL